MMTSSMETLPQAFIWRRLHSLTGVWLVAFVVMHLLTNSQAALFFGDDGQGFIRSVNSIHEMPYLPLIEIAVLVFPILIHLAWGIKYLRSAKYNSFGNTGKTPYLPQYPRNHAYTWQRITAWLLVVGIIAHVVQMRFIEYPTTTFKNGEHFYLVKVTQDGGLYTLSDRLDVTLYDKQQIASIIAPPLPATSEAEKTDVRRMLDAQAQHQEINWRDLLQKYAVKDNEVIAVAKSFGAAELLMVRDTFKMPFMLVLYTLLVLATCFHAFNGLWTFMISWGVTLTERSQRLMRCVATTFMVVVSVMGLAAVWLTYWVNLKQ